MPAGICEISLTAGKNVFTRPKNLPFPTKIVATSVPWYDFGGLAGSGVLRGKNAVGSGIAAEFDSDFGLYIYQHSH
jgi:hypothetical protein